MSKLKTLVIGSVICAGFVGTAMANNVKLINKSEDGKPLEVEYRIARMNPNEDVVYSDVQHITLHHKQAIGFDLNGYKMAGVVTVSINGHRLPEAVRAFPPTPETCSVATSHKRRHGKIFLSYKEGQDGRGGITCSTKSGDLQSYSY